MNESWVAFEYNHKDRRWRPSEDIRRVYHSVGHIKSALANHYRLHWEIKSEAPDLIECEWAVYLENPALGRGERGRIKLERHIASGHVLVFIEITNKIEQNTFPPPPPLPDTSGT